MANYHGNANLLASSIQYIINVVMTVPALIYIDRWGRRKMMIIGAFFMMVWMFANAGILGGQGTIIPGGVNGIPEASMKVTGSAATGLIACTYLFVASYAPTWGPVSWVYPPELYPLRVRGKAVALATSANWAFNTALGAFVPPAFVSIRYKVYIIFGLFNFLMMVHAALLFPETAGKTLEDTEAMFTDPNGFAYLGTPAWKTHVNHQHMQEMEVSFEQGQCVFLLILTSTSAAPFPRANVARSTVIVTSRQIGIARRRSEARDSRAQTLVHNLTDESIVALRFQTTRKFAKQISFQLIALTTSYCFDRNSYVPQGKLHSADQMLASPVSRFPAVLKGGSLRRVSIPDSRTVGRHFNHSMGPIALCRP